MNTVICCLYWNKEELDDHKSKKKDYTEMSFTLNLATLSLRISSSSSFSAKQLSASRYSGLDLSWTAYHVHQVLDVWRVELLGLMVVLDRSLVFHNGLLVQKQELSSNLAIDWSQELETYILYSAQNFAQLFFRIILGSFGPRAHVLLDHYLIGLFVLVESARPRQIVHHFGSAICPT